MEGNENTGLASEIGPRLRAYRESEKISQKGLAEAVQGTLRGIQDNESAKSAPNSKILKALAERGLNVNWLLTGKGPVRLTDIGELQGSREPLDVGLLAFVVDALNRALKKPGCSLTTPKYAEVAAILYDFCLKAGGRDSSMAERLVRLARATSN